MSTASLVLLNACAMAALQLSFAYGAERLDARRFAKLSVFYRPRGWEQRVYRMVGVRWWKDALPDGASWVGGKFSKARLARRDLSYLREFAIETRRGETAHWWMAACTPIFFLWNPMWTWPIFGLYALVANGPCIVAQRYNRATLLRILSRANVA